MKRSLVSAAILAVALIVAPLAATKLVSRHTRPAITNKSTDLGENGAGDNGKDWTTPFNGAGTEVTSVDDAQRYVDFAIAAPKGFKPTRIFVNSSVDVVGFSFDLPGQANGWVQLVEGKGNITPQEYQQNFLNGAHQSPGFFSATSLDGGRVAATLAAANNRGRLLWIDNGVNFDVAGEAVTPGQITALVSQMLYSGR